MEKEKKVETKKEPIEEPREFNVSLSLGKTHFEALRRWSREKFGRENRAGFLAFIIDERLKHEQGRNGL